MWTAAFFMPKFQGPFFVWGWPHHIPATRPHGHYDDPTGHALIGIRVSVILDWSTMMATQTMQKTLVQLKWKDWDCEIVPRYYGNSRPALQLIDANDGCPIATATLNLPEEKLDDDEICIKNYSENMGMLESLLEHGLVDEPTRFIQLNHVRVPVCKMRPALRDLFH